MKQIVFSRGKHIEKLRMVHTTLSREIGFIVLTILTTSLTLQLAADTNEDFKIVQQGKPTATIVIRADAPQWTKTAADWLVEYVHKASGASLPLYVEGQPLPAGRLISVGATRLASEAGISAENLKWDACRLIVKDNTLFLLGHDNPGTKTHDWVGARGTNRAVIKLLEDYAGIRWFLPSPHGELVPRTTDLHVPVNLNVHYQPAFAYSDGRSVYDVNILNEPGKSLSAQANNYRKAVKAAPGGHSYYEAVSADQYFGEHPEYFALIDGKRTKRGNHLCTSNPEVKRLLIQYMRSRYDQGLDWVSLGQEDGYLRCQCERCENIDNYRWTQWAADQASQGIPIRWESFQRTVLRETPCERLFLLHKDISDSVAESHPGKVLMLMSYAPTAWPSKKIPYFGDHVIVEMMNLNQEYIAAWRGKVAGFTGFTYWFNTQCPMGVNLHMTAEDVTTRLRYLYKNGFMAISLDPEANWGLEGPLNYLMGRLMGDPSQEHEAIVAEYCRGVFEDAHQPMLRFFDLLQERLAEVIPIPDTDIAADFRNTRLPRWLTTSQMYLSMYPPEVLKTLESHIQEAEKRAQTERAEGWVRLSRDHFDFIKLLTEMLISYRAYQVRATDANLAELKETVDQFEAYRLKIIHYKKEYTDKWFPGHGTFCKWLVGNLENTDTAFYVSWEDRKAAVLKKGVHGMAMGYGTSYYYSFIREPLTLDLD